MSGIKNTLYSKNILDTIKNIYVGKSFLDRIIVKIG